MAKMLMLNPSPRKRRKKAKRKSYAKNPVIRTRTRTVTVARPKRRRYRRNPIGGMKANTVVKQTVDALVGAGGAIGVSTIAKMLPLPAIMQTGYMRDLTHGALAIGLGYVVEKGLKQHNTGRQLAQGALTVIAHNAMLRAFGANLGLPTPVDGYGADWGTAIYPGIGTGIYGNMGTGIGAYDNAGPLGAYIN